MLFSSITFLYYFLPIVIVVYYLSPQKYQNLVLLASSLLFYSWGEPRHVLLMVFSISMGFFMGLILEKVSRLFFKKVLFVISIFMVLLPLVYFKYGNFIISQINTLQSFNLSLKAIPLPIGISFYTFQILGYLSDIYNNKYMAQKNILHFGCYVSFFPQLVAGPIVRYNDIRLALNSRNPKIDDFCGGLKLFLIGLAKKILLANQLGEFCQIFRDTSQPSVTFYWLYAIAFTLQIYFDFSGYSDMAIGLGHFFGFSLPQNFNYPYISKSISEFWRRWHMTLGSWFRDYVYIPLGGSHVSISRKITNLLIVWFLTGLWHGASWLFILWGILYGLLIGIEKLGLNQLLKRFPAWLSHLYVLIFVILGFVLFNANDLNQAINDYQNLLGLGELPLLTNETLYYMQTYRFTFLIAIFSSTPIVSNLTQYLSPKVPSSFASIIEFSTLVFILLLSTSYLVSGSFNPFLYFRF